MDMKKLLIMVILAMTVAGCELFDVTRWDRVNREAKEKGRTCYRRNDGYFYCKDKYGNRVD